MIDKRGRETRGERIDPQMTLATCLTASSLMCACLCLGRGTWLRRRLLLRLAGSSQVRLSVCVVVGEADGAEARGDRGEGSLRRMLHSAVADDCLIADGELARRTCASLQWFHLLQASCPLQAGSQQGLRLFATKMRPNHWSRCWHFEAQAEICSVRLWSMRFLRSETTPERVHIERSIAGHAGSRRVHLQHHREATREESHSE